MVRAYGCRRAGRSGAIGVVCLVGHQRRRCTCCSALGGALGSAGFCQRWRADGHTRKSKRNRAAASARWAVAQELCGSGCWMVERCFSSTRLTRFEDGRRLAASRGSVRRFARSQQRAILHGHVLPRSMLARGRTARWATHRLQHSPVGSLTRGPQRINARPRADRERVRGGSSSACMAPRTTLLDRWILYSGGCHDTRPRRCPHLRTALSAGTPTHAVIVPAYPPSGSPLPALV
jgi:hypothetical protein